MPSAQKFPSGLNNWISSDVPLREDFISDNEILNENALWKQDYDAEGNVAAAGGIDVYALKKSLYDPAGVVAEKGGIQSAIMDAVSANEGYKSFAHNKTGTTHALTGEGGNIKFVATSAFASGDGFLVNGAACTAQTADGEPLSDGCFVAGAVVSCFLEGTALNFKSGGAGENFKVVGGNNKPSAPSENTVWVNTAQPITEWQFCTSKPVSRTNKTAFSGGEVWFQTGAGSQAAFNAAKKGTLMVYPYACAQYSDGAFVKRAAQVFQNGAWRVMGQKYLDGGDVFTDITGGFSQVNAVSGAYQAPVFNSGGILMANTAYIVRTVGSARPVDLTNINTLYFTYSTENITGTMNCFSLGVHPTRVAGQTNGAIVIGQQSWAAEYYAGPATGTAANAVVAVNVSALSGLHYLLAANTCNASSTRTLTVHQIWGE